MTRSYAAPSGGVVTSGTAQITQSGTTTNINQSTSRASINWQNFSINANETVNFNQPNVNAITLNRVLGNERSVIDGALNANGQVWLLNSNGVLFNAHAKINTSGLLATTKAISDEDFQNGSYHFKGDSDSPIINLGTIDIANGGYASLLAHSVNNEGAITAIQGVVTLTGAKEATINLNGNSLVALTVDKGVLDALVENKGAVIADGGKIFLTTNAANELLKGVVNNSGTVQANSLDDVTGQVEVFAHGGTAHIGGVIEATGGFVETSGKEFTILDGARITAKDWLLDPVDITIDSALATSISTALNSGNVTITTNGSNTPSTASGESGTSGDITVSSSISKTSGSDTTLTLKAARNITVDSGVSISSTSGKLNTVLWANNGGNGGGITLNDGSSVSTNGGHLWMGGGSGSAAWNGLTVGNSYAKGIGSNVAGINFNGSSAITLDTNDGTIHMYGQGSDGGGQGVRLAYTLVTSGTTGAIDIRGDGLGSSSGSGVGGGVVVGESALIAGSGGLSLTGNASINNIGGSNIGLGMLNGTVSSSGGSVDIHVSAPLDSSKYNRYIDAGGLVGADNSTIGDASTTNISITASGTAQGKVLLPNVIASGNLVVDVSGSSATSIQQDYLFKDSIFSSGTTEYYNLAIGGTSSFTGNANTAYTLPGTNNDFIGSVSVNTGTNLTIYDKNSLPIRVVSGLSGALNLTAPDGIDLIYTLSNKSGYTYNGNAVDLSNIWTVGSIFGASFTSSWQYGTDYIFKDGSGNAVANYLNAGTYVGISVDILKSGYGSAPSGNTTGSVTINKANATITANSGTATYTGQTQAVSGYTATGLVNGETAAVLTGVTEAGGSGVNAGNYTHTLSGSDINYNLTLVNGALAINKANATITGNSGSVTYNGQTQAVSGYTVSGLVNGETAAVLDSVAISGSGKNAGIYSVTGSASDNNYNLTVANGTLTINKAPLTITAVTNSKSYDGTSAAAALPTVSGVLGSDTVSGLKEAYDSSNAATGKNLTVTGYTVNDGNSGNNYTVTTVNDSTGVINKANATVAANSGGTTYNGQVQAVNGFTATGLVNGETTAVLTGISEAGGSGVNVGSYIHTVSGADANYNLTFVNGTLVINKANATITANSGSGTYNGQTQTVSGYTATGLVNGETAAVLTGVTEAGGSGINAGTYSHTLSGTDTNYNLTFVNGSLAINKANATITGNSGTVTYNGQTQAVSGYTVSGLVNGETAAVLDSVAISGSGKNAGTYAVTGSASDNNYNLTVANGTLTINKAPLTITAVTNTKSYDGTSSAAALPTVSGLVGSDTVSGLREAYGTTNAGTGKTLTVTGYTVNDGNSGNNYTITTVNDSTGVINKANATVTVNSGVVTYNGQTQSISGYTASGLVNGETSAVLDSVVISGGGKNTGTYAVTGTASDNNYNLTVSNGTLTINRAPLSITAISSTKNYDGTTSAAALPAVSGLQGSDTVTGLSEAYDNAATGSGKTVTVTGYTVNDGNSGNNYTITTASNSTGVINKAKATVAINNSTINYNGQTQTAPANGYTVTGLVNGETAAVLDNVTVSGSGKYLGTYVVTGTASDNNYDLSVVNGSLTIAKNQTLDDSKKAIDSIATTVQTQQSATTPGTSASNQTRLAAVDTVMTTLTRMQQLTALKDSGVSPTDLKNAGYSAEDLKKAGYPAADLKAAGYDIISVLFAGYSDTEIKSAYSAKELRDIGGDADAMKTMGFSFSELKNAGFSASDLAGAGYRPSDYKNMGYSMNDLKNMGYSAADLAKTGYSLTDLKNANYSAADLKKAGFSPSELKSSGYDMNEIMFAGYATDEIKNAYSAKELKDLGGTTVTLKAMGYTQDELLQSGYSANDLKSAGFTIKDLDKEKYSAVTLLKAGYSVSDLSSIDYSLSDLKSGGALASDLKKAGYDSFDLRKAGYTVDELKKGGYAPGDVLGALNLSLRTSSQLTIDDILSGKPIPPQPTYTYKDIYSASELKAAGFTADKLKQNNYSVTEIKNAGYSASDLKNAGYPASDLAKIGISLAELKGVGYTASDLKKAGFSANALKSIEFSAAELKNAGFTATDLKATGFSVAELKDSGFSASELKASGFPVADLKSSGFSATELRAAGCSASELKASGFSIADLKSSGFSASDLKATGYSASELSATGFTIADLKSSGFSAAELNKAGLAKNDILSAGYSAADLKSAGYSATDLRGRYTSTDLKAAGYSAADLKQAGFSAGEMVPISNGVNVGYALNDLKSAGYSAAELKNTGAFSLRDLMSSGFTLIDLKNIGYTVWDFNDIGFSPKDLKKAGYSAADLKKAGETAMDLQSLGFTNDEIKRLDYPSKELRRAGILPY